MKNKVFQKMNFKSKIYIAGHNGMVGSSLFRKLKSIGYSNLITISSKELDLRNQIDVKKFFKENKPEYVFLAAAKVGGILANSVYRADFIYNNLQIQNNIIQQSYLNGVKKLLFLGSSCIYPRECKQPIKEKYFLSGKLEKSNRPYAIAKIAGIELCQSYSSQHNCNFISLMPTNLYGTNDNYDLNTSHVFPALIKKIIEARENGDEEVVLWGTGKPMREFLHVDDLSDASIFLMNNYDDPSIINIGWGMDISIKDLAYKISTYVGYDGLIKFDSEKKDGTPRKVLDISKITNLGWSPKITLDEGIQKTVKEYLQIYERGK